jgi:putative hydrolase of the HAD superfamily
VSLNLVFDLGGVLVRWEPENLIAGAFDDPEVRKAVYSEFVGHPDWLELDRGTLAPADAVARASERTGLSRLELARFLQRVPYGLIAISDTVDLLYRLKAQGHSLFCLSNMHLASIEYLEQAYDFFTLFAGKVISCRLNLCKPEPKIYAHLLETYGLDAADTVFIDDVEGNLVPARQMGIKTIRFESSVQCAGELRTLGCVLKS